jgi:hypothetical protein
MQTSSMARQQIDPSTAWRTALESLQIIPDLLAEPSAKLSKDSKAIYYLAAHAEQQCGRALYPEMIPAAGATPQQQLQLVAKQAQQKLQVGAATAT